MLKHITLLLVTTVSLGMMAFTALADSPTKEVTGYLLELSNPKAAEGTMQIAVVDPTMPDHFQWSTKKTSWFPNNPTSSKDAEWQGKWVSVRYEPVGGKKLPNAGLVQVIDEYEAIQSVKKLLREVSFRGTLIKPKTGGGPIELDVNAFPGVKFAMAGDSQERLKNALGDADRKIVVVKGLLIATSGERKSYPLINTGLMIIDAPEPSVISKRTVDTDFIQTEDRLPVIEVPKVPVPGKGEYMVSPPIKSGGDTVRVTKGEITYSAKYDKAGDLKKATKLALAFEWEQPPTEPKPKMFVLGKGSLPYAVKYESGGKQVNLIAVRIATGVLEIKEVLPQGDAPPSQAAPMDLKSADWLTPHVNGPLVIVSCKCRDLVLRAKKVPQKEGDEKKPQAQKASGLHFGEEGTKSGTK